MSRILTWLMLCTVPTILVMAADQTASEPATQPGSSPVDNITQPIGDERTPLSARRIVKTFDFDERPVGNYDTLPMSWRRHSGDGFPIFLEGRFDTETGHLAPPSFRLDLNGGSLAYHYEGQDIAVRPACDYLVVAWIKTAGLKNARAWFSAFFLDRKNIRIQGTEQRSSLVGDTDSEGGWKQITLQLRCNLKETRYLGLSVWLGQKRTWNPTLESPYIIHQEDIKGTVWFDDVAVYRMPRITLSSSHVGNVFADQEPVEIYPEVTDPDGLNLEARLNVSSEDGSFKDERTVPVQLLGVQSPQPLVYRDLPIGSYRVELTTRTRNQVLMRQSLRFLRVAARTTPPTAGGRRFGVILDDIMPETLAGRRELLDDLRPQLVKLPLWDIQAAMAGQETSITTADAYLEAIRRINAEPIAVMLDMPSFEENHARYSQIQMLKLFNEDPLGWKPFIAGLWTRYAGLIPLWQIGQDGHSWGDLEERLPSVISRLRREMEELMNEPRLAVAIPPMREPVATSADLTCHYLPAMIDPRDIARSIPRVSPSPEKGDTRISVTVEPLPAETYPRELRLADLARRLTETAFQNVETVFIRAPWESTTVPLASYINPREDYIILRTVSDLLGAAKPISRMSLAGQVECLVFDRNGEAILCLWDDYASPTGHAHHLLLGARAEQVDLWGRRTPLAGEGLYKTVQVGPTPTFIVNTLTWLVEFQRQFKVTPQILEPSFDQLSLAVVFRNTYSESMDGMLRLLLPADWEVHPNLLPFSLKPNQTFQQTVQVRFPLNSRARIMSLTGEFSFDAGNRFVFATPAWFDFGLRDIDIRTNAYRDDQRVTVQVSMRNRTARDLYFEGSLIAKNRPRNEQVFHNILPGQSMTRRFVLNDAADLAGQSVRVSLKETQGDRLWNQVVTIP